MGRHHHTKVKGDLGVLKAQADLCEQGFVILVPMTEHAPFDLVAYKDGVFKRVQVKCRTIDKTGAICVHFRSSWADRNGTHYTPMINQKLIYFVFIVLILISATILTRTIMEGRLLCE
jgi:hypothetical protein